jgi:hypothetical protein
VSTTIAPSAKSKQTAAPRQVRRGLGEILAWSALAALLVVALPLFLCMGLFSDVAYYGVFAQAIARGGILERDVMVYFRPPTMGWILLAIQWLAGGWHTEAVRMADFLFLSADIWLMVHWLKPMGVSRVGRIWTAVVLFSFYFSTSEWCHCQPDAWMMLPALGALYLRQRQLEQLLRPQVSPLSVGAWATLEGFLWGVGCLFKPYVVVPGALCWLIATAFVYLRSRRLGPLVVDALGMVVGGLLAGGIWMLWLKWGGGWPYFWDDVRGWSGHYFTYAPTNAFRIVYLVTHFPPWGLVHVVALPVAVAAIYRLLIGARRQDRASAEMPSLTRAALQAAFFLGFFFEGNFLQLQFDYHIIPGLLLGITLLAGQIGIRLGVRRGGIRRVVVQCPLGTASLRPGFVVAVVGAVLAVAVVRHPLHDLDRPALWPRCWREGGSPDLKDRLALDISYYPPTMFPSYWKPLAAVEDYLRAQGVHDGEVTCFGMHTVQLYLDLDITPSTRFPFLEVATATFHKKHPLFQRLLNASKQRFVVSDLRWLKPNLDRVAPEELSKTNTSGIPELDKCRKQGAFPWVEPVVFRAGPYLVHRVKHKVKGFQ